MKRLRSRWKLAKTMEEAEKHIEEMDEQIRKKVKSQDLKTAMSVQSNLIRLPGITSGNKSNHSSTGYIL